MNAEEIDYLAPNVPAILPWHTSEVVKATPESLKGYGVLVDDYKDFKLEIVTWPKEGGRPIDPGTGNQAGTKSGIFDFWWEGDFFFGKNHAVNDEYLLGWAVNPGEALRDKENTEVPKRVLLWHANYHPDGGQLFFPLDGTPYIVPLALPGDEVTPAKFVSFYFEGDKGVYIHPNVWHEGIFPLAQKARFYDAQGSVHARVSVNFPDEFGVFLEAPLSRV